MDVSIQFGDLGVRVKEAAKLLEGGSLDKGLKELADVSGRIQKLELELGDDSRSAEHILKLRTTCAESFLKGLRQSQGIQGSRRRMINEESLVMLPDETLFLDEIVGMSEVKLALTQAIVLPNVVKDFVPDQHKIRGILLYGVSGVGKSKIIKAFCNSVAKTTDAKVTFFNVGLDCILGSHHGETEKNLTDIFNLAATKPSPVLCFDEIDSISADRQKKDRNGEFRKRNILVNISNHLLSLLDGVSSHPGLVVIGTTNRVFNMDEAFFRRFDKMLHVELPGQRQREDILQTLLYRIQDATLCRGIDFKKLAGLTERYSPADLCQLLTEAFHQVRSEKVCMGAVKQMESRRKCNFKVLMRDKSVYRPIGMDDLLVAQRNTSAKNPRKSVSKLEKFAEEYGSKAITYADQIGDLETAAKFRKQPLSWGGEVACMGIEFLFGE